MFSSSHIPNRFRLTPGDIQMGVAMRRGGQDALIRAVITLDGRTDPAILRRALRLLLDAEPIAGCRLVEGKRRPYAERTPNLDAVEVLTIFDLPDRAAVEEALARWSLAPLDAHDGPLVRAALFRPADGGDTLCLKLQHLLCDGGGALDLLYELAAVYAALERNAAYRPTPNVRGDRGYWQIVRRLSLRELREALRQRPFPWMMMDGSTWSLPLPPGEGPGALVARELPAGRLATGRAYARAHGATVNDVFLAAWYRAIYRLVQPPAGTRLVVMTHVNHRRHLPNRQAGGLANLSQMTPTSIGAELGDTLADTVARVHAEMERVKAIPPMLAMQLQMALLSPARLQRQMQRRMSKMPRRTRRGLPPLFNNVGAVDPARLALGAPATNAYLTACLGREGDSGLQVVLTTCGERVNLVVVMRENDIIWQTLEALLAAFADELAATACQG
jgi:NRPS condensation-like uncharacterized protein